MDLQHQSTNALNIKVKLLEMIIRESEDDPRVWRPKEQLAIIQEELERRNKEAEELIIEDEKGDPENLVVGLKTIELKVR